MGQIILKIFFDDFIELSDKKQNHQTRCDSNIRFANEWATYISARKIRMGKLPNHRVPTLVTGSLAIDLIYSLELMKMEKEKAKCVSLLEVSIGHCDGMQIWSLKAIKRKFTL